MTDALEMFRSMRPTMPDAAGAPSGGRGRDLHDLAMVPGSASYRARIPPPPCFQCGEDHVTGQSYDHSWTPEPPPLAQVHDEPVSASAVIRRPAVVEMEASAPRRVALYVGRHDTYVVAVEEPPDWDAISSFKVEPAQVLPLISLARALGVKIADKTGGDLVMLETEDVGQHAQADGGRTPPNGSAEPRRQGPAPDRSTTGEPAGAEAAHGDVPGGRGQRRHPAG